MPMSFDYKRLFDQSMRSHKLLAATITCVVLVGVSVHTTAAAATYYVGPTGGASKLSASAAAPGSLSFALYGTGNGSGGAVNGDTVILENGTYDGGPKGFTVYNSGVTFRAKTWHAAIIKNDEASALINPANDTVTDDIWQGIIFGPVKGLGWSGGGGEAWKFLDCVFREIGGVGSGSESLFEHDLFTDASSNSFDIGGGPDKINSNVVVKDCIVRRSNRVSGDDDAVGNKEFFTRNLTFDDLVAYDNNGATLWFDTDNDDWVIKNSTFFGNHGGADWYYCRSGNGVSTAQFTGYGQDGEQITEGQPIKCIRGTAADVGSESFVTAVSGSNPQMITISPALPATPAPNDQFLVGQLRTASGDGFITEANDDGLFTDNVVYGNTDHGFFDHSSGGKQFGGTNGINIIGNLFAYNGESVFVWSDQRDTGAATIEHNQFKFVAGTDSPFDSWGSTPGLYPYKGSITFDYNVYDPANSNGKWVAWFGTNPPESAGAVTAAYAPAGQDYFQNPKTWNQEQHGSSGAVTFWGTSPKTYVWPGAKDSAWTDIFYPNNNFGLSNSIHQIDDTDGAVINTIDGAIAGRKTSETVSVSVSAHTPLVNGTCEVYDLNGRWVALTVPNALKSHFLSTVPPYVTCAPGNKTVTYRIRLNLTSTDPYNVCATLTKQ
jgi:hypothetical protein